MLKNLDVILRNSIGEIVLGDKGLYKITSLQGLETTDREISVNSNYRADGAKLEFRKLRERSITIEADYLGTGEENERQKLIRMFNSKEPLHIVVNRCGIEKVIDAEVESFSLPIDNLYETMELNLELTALDPYMTDENETLVDLNNWIGGVTFPLKLPFTLKQKGTTEVNVYNSGDVETPLTIYFKGPATNPKITNKTTGEFIRVKQTLAADDTLIINTAFGHKTVEILKSDGTIDNAFNYIDLATVFFSLHQGDNILSYSADSLEPSGVSIRYRNKYSGI